MIRPNIVFSSTIDSQEPRAPTISMVIKMQRPISLFFRGLLFGTILSIMACSDSTNTAPVTEEGKKVAATADAVAIEVYKSPTCGCCELWVEHMNTKGFKSSVQHPDDLNAIKDKFGIKPEYQSCHTAVSTEGYIFEGHVPARLVQRFLAEKPANAIGLAVPGMPLGSPGMEVDERITPYDVLLLYKDGTSSVYERVSSLEK